MRPHLESLAGYAGRLHTATCTITRPAGAPVYDPETNSYTPGSTIEVYAGPCQVLPSGGERVQQFGEGPITTREHTVSIADLTVDARVGDTVTVTATRDPLLVDRRLVVLDVPKSEHVTVRRLVCEEVL